MLQRNGETEGFSEQVLMGKPKKWSCGAWKMERAIGGPISTEPATTVKATKVEVASEKERA